MCKTLSSRLSNMFYKKFFFYYFLFYIWCYAVKYFILPIWELKWFVIYWSLSEHTKFHVNVVIVCSDKNFSGGRYCRCMLPKYEKNFSKLSAIPACLQQVQRGEQCSYTGCQYIYKNLYLLKSFYVYNGVDLKAKTFFKFSASVVFVINKKGLKILLTVFL